MTALPAVSPSDTSAPRTHADAVLQLTASPVKILTNAGSMIYFAVIVLKGHYARHNGRYHHLEDILERQNCKGQIRLVVTRSWGCGEGMSDCKGA